MLVHIRSLKVDSDQSWACLVNSELIYVGQTDGWMDGVVIIGHRPSKSTFGANKKEQIQIGLGLATALMILRFLCLLAVLHGLSSTKPLPS